MTTIESIFLIIMAIICLPTICRFINYPALLYCFYIVIGVLIGSFIEIGTRQALQEIGKVGFILLLFLIGLEINIPSFSVIKKSLLFCLSWVLIQNGLFMLVGWQSGLGLGYSLVAGVGVNACSLGIAYSLLKTQENQLEKKARSQILVELALIEIVSLFILVGSDVVYKHGWGNEVLWQIGTILLFVTVIKFLSPVVHRFLADLTESTGKWKIHQLILIILSVTIIGERLGLSAPKTAFFLGLFMTATGRGVRFEDELKPIAQRILIPLFFVGLGTRISLEVIYSSLLPISFAITAALLLIRYLIFKYTSTTSLGGKYFLMYCPNITMVAVAAEVLLHNQVAKQQVDLLLLVGLLMTVGVVLCFPSFSEASVSSFIRINKPETVSLANEGERAHRI